MNKKQIKKHNMLQTQEEDLSNAGVSRRLLNENDELKKQISLLKKSLKELQNQHQSLTDNFHIIDKEKLLLEHMVSTNKLLDTLKEISILIVGIFVPFLFSFKGELLILCIIIILIFIAFYVVIQRNKNNATDL